MGQLWKKYGMSPLRYMREKRKTEGEKQGEAAKQTE